MQICQKPVQIRVNVEKNVFFCYISLAMAKGLRLVFTSNRVGVGVVSGVARVLMTK